jgi:hypothetical protein
MENLLDAIVNGQDVRPVAPLAGHSFARGTQITEAGINYASMAASAYRGLGRDVAIAHNDPRLIAEMAGMDWKTVKMPLAIVGKVETRPFDGMKALVRSDNGMPLAVCTDDYKPHHNDQLLKTMTDFAKESNLTLSRVGLFDGGKRGFAVATSGINREARVGDVVAMHIVLKFGHAPGTATQFKVWANELRCSNGACLVVSQGNARFVHSAELTPNRIADARKFVQLAADAFGGYVDTLADLRGVQSNKGIDLLQLTQLFQPALAQQISDRLTRPTNAAHGDIDHMALGRGVLDALLNRDESQRIVAQMIERDADRLLNNVIEATIHQPGGDMTVGTMAHAYSGVTNFNSNIRGRSADTGLESNLFGTAQEDTRRALQVAVATSQVLRTMN